MASNKAPDSYKQPPAGWPPQGQQAPAAYGQTPAVGGYGSAPAYGQAASPAGPYGSQPGGAIPYAAPTGYGAQNSMPGGYNASSAPMGYGAPPSVPGGYGVPTGYGAPAATTGYGQQPPAGYGAPAAQGGYGGYSQGGYGQQYPPQQPPGAYPAPAVGGFPLGTDPEVVRMFQQADVDRSGTIDAGELGRVLSGGRVAFSPRTLRLMLHLFADNRKDTTRIGPAGFEKLWKEIQQWNKKFNEFDRDGSGSIDVRELQEALMSFNFNIPQAVLQMLVSKYDTTGGSRSIGYDNFVECGFIVKGLTENFKSKDQNFSGNATFDYASFMLMVIPFVAA